MVRLELGGMGAGRCVSQNYKTRDGLRRILVAARMGPLEGWARLGRARQPMEREDLEGDSRQREGGRRPVRLGGAHACLAIALRLGVGSVARLEG